MRRASGSSSMNEISFGFVTLAGADAGGKATARTSASSSVRNDMAAGCAECSECSQCSGLAPAVGLALELTSAAAADEESCGCDCGCDAVAVM